MTSPAHRLVPRSDARQDNPQKALELFVKVVTLETEKGPEIKWRFKALEHLVRIHFQLREFDQMLEVCQMLVGPH